MSLQFILGNSGSGKSTYLYKNMLEEAAKHPEKAYLLLVPEQFTMQTQRDLVTLAPNHVITNLEVLSFRRLAYRVFDELGLDTLEVLEETGKNLVLRRVAEKCEKDLVFLSGHMTRPGYITELRSLISELTQYRIDPKTLHAMGEVEGLSNNFSQKIHDLEILYQEFQAYMDGAYITAEEVLTLLEENVSRSSLLKNATIGLDGFTGFTPTQTGVLYELFRVVDRIQVTGTMDYREDYLHLESEEELFAMPKEMVKSLMQIARDTEFEVEEPLLLGPQEKGRFLPDSALMHLEKNLFRGELHPYQKNQDEIHITRAENPREELHLVAESIMKHCHKEGMRYHKVAIVTASLDDYKEYAEDIFKEYGIPLYLDVKITPSDHPLVELIRNFFGLLTKDFSRRSVMAFLRSGLPILPMDEVDRLDNYLIATGARGRSMYQKGFTYEPKQLAEEGLGEINEIRQHLMEKVDPYLQKIQEANGDVRQMATALFEFLDAENMEEELQKREDELLARGQDKTAHVYDIIFFEVMDLLSKMVDLLEGDSITPEEFVEILDAGIDTLKIGTIPSNNDMVVFGDLERTRLHDIDVLYVVGVNDAWIPKDDSRGGILSDYERQVLEEHSFELSPTSRIRAFRQRYYLYSVLSKAGRELNLSYVRRYSDGASASPSYLIKEFTKLFPELQVQEQRLTDVGGYYSLQKIRRVLTDLLREERAIPGSVSGDETRKGIYRDLLTYEAENDSAAFLQILDRVFFTHEDEVIDSTLREELSGDRLDGSVSRLEDYASCPYSYFLKYGLSLHEREEYEMNAIEVGNIYHDVLNGYSKLLISKGYDWGMLSPENRTELVNEAIQSVYDSQYRRKVFEDARGTERLSRMKDSVSKAIDLLEHHAAKGIFIPRHFEYDLSSYETGGALLSALHLPLSDGRMLDLRGRVDRIDTMEKDGTVYIRVMDYKTGAANVIDPDRTKAGLEIQLLLYMNAVLEGEAHRAGVPTAPAEILYYHLQNQEISASDAEKIPRDAVEQAVQEKLLEQSAQDGLALNQEAILAALEDTSLSLDGKKHALPGKSKLLEEGNFRGVISTVRDIAKNTAEEILSGQIPTKPYRQGKHNGCEYCSYHAVCGFDQKLPGYSYREISGKASWEDFTHAEVDG